jgi:hypothetical protein
MVEHSEFWGAPVVRRGSERERERPRPLEAAQCSLCGIELPKGLLMPDGGIACTDIRWYCRDTRSCTERWTARLPQGRAALPRTAPALEPAALEPMAREPMAREPMALEPAAAEPEESRGV